MRGAMIRQRLFKDQVLTDRERKNISILELIGKNGPMTKTDISKLTELNIVTVSNYINNYIKAGIIEEKGFDISTGGRKPTLLGIHKNNILHVGI
jgi:predicted HTH transcriptional regulator